jgi:uncharacterized protein (DUF2062 family)
MIAWLKERTKTIMSLEQNRHKFIMAIALAVYIAFSPFVGLHTAMSFCVAWYIEVNVALVLTVSMLINNPWTMVPVYGAGYWLGILLFTWLDIDPYAFNPSWVAWCTQWLERSLGFPSFSLWAFMVGGNVIGIAGALIAYFFLSWWMGRLKHRQMLEKVVSSAQKVRSLPAKAAPLLHTVQRKSRTAYEGGSSK